jgi:hypothetical protein
MVYFFNAYSAQVLIWTHDIADCTGISKIILVQGGHGLENDPEIFEVCGENQICIHGKIQEMNCIVMGNVKLPSIKHYWSRNIIHYSIERWDAIHLKWFCVTCAFKTTPLLVYIKYTTFSTNIQNTYYPGRNLSLNERGRLYFRQYIPNKAAKYGVKLYELCTPDGFVLNI